MKHILCYGDSNTWGADSVTGKRFDENHRWPSLLSRELGSGFLVVEEGLCGRTTVYEDPGTRFRNGKDMIIPVLRTHKPLDLVILMLGTNDLKPGMALDSADVANGVETLIRMIQDPASLEGEAVRPQILVVSPIEVRESIERSFFCEAFGGMNAVRLSRELAPRIEAVAKRNGCLFLDAARYAQASDADAIHISAEGHASLAHALAEKVRESIG